MFRLIRLFLKYYIPIVVLFGLVNFFEPANYLDKPIHSSAFDRFLTSIFHAATFTGEGFSGAWSKYWDWLYAGGGFDGSKSNAIIVLVQLVVAGFVLGNLLFAPIYAFGWATNQERLWVTRFVQMTWRRPRFRTLAFVSSLGICVIVFLFSMLSSLPVLAAFALFLGVYIAFQNPLILNIALSVVDLYGITPTPQAQTFFSRISDAIERKFRLPQSTGASSSVVSPVAPQGLVKKKQAKPQRSRSNPSSKKLSPSKKNWQDRING